MYGIIYKHTFPNGKCYVGQTTRPLAARLRVGYSGCGRMQNAIKSHGRTFKTEILYAAESKDELDFAETLLIEALRSNRIQHGYNLMAGGRHPIHDSTTRRLISVRITGRTFSAEHRRNLSLAQIGRPVSEETRRKIGAKHKGKTISAETREKYSEYAISQREVYRERGRRPENLARLADARQRGVARRRKKVAA